jgi:hypothetical protein
VTGIVQVDVGQTWFEPRFSLQATLVQNACKDENQTDEYRSGQNDIDQYPEIGAVKPEENIEADQNQQGQQRTGRKDDTCEAEPVPGI